jgi:hypothetical protein
MIYFLFNNKIIILFKIYKKNIILIMIELYALAGLMGLGYAINK